MLTQLSGTEQRNDYAVVITVCRRLSGVLPPFLNNSCGSGGLRQDAETAGKLCTLTPSVSAPRSDDLPRGVMPAVPLIVS